MKSEADMVGPREPFWAKCGGGKAELGEVFRRLENDERGA